MDKKIQILLVGVEPSVKKTVLKQPAQFSTTEIENEYDLDKLIQSPASSNNPIVICGPTITKYPSAELAQTMRMLHPQSAIFFITEQFDLFARKTLMDEGFTEVFLLPIDLEFFQKKFNDIILTVNKLKNYRPVKIIDIQPDTVLDFDVSIYMSMNHHFIKYSNKGDPIDADRLKNLENHQHNSIYIPHEDMDKFYKYSANKLLFLSQDTVLSETERSERLEVSIRDLVTGIFNPSLREASVESGKLIFKDTKKIVQQYITQKHPQDWYKKIVNATSDVAHAYSHASGVSTLAALLSIGLQVGVPEELAIAGIYHDLGLAEVDAETLNKPQHMRSSIENALYNKHPETTIKMLLHRKILVPRSVEKAILQHHERWNGRGFPKKLQGDQISIEAKILGLADQLEYMTCLEKGKPKMTPIKAIHKLKADETFEPEFLDKVLRLMPQEAS